MSTDIQLRQMLEWKVFGVIMNNPNGPQSWSGDFTGGTSLDAALAAREMVAQDPWFVQQGIRGVLLVNAVLQLNGDGEMVDHANWFWADDPSRPQTNGLVGYQIPSCFSGK